MALDWVQQALRERLGFIPYPATLNLRLQSREDVSAWSAVRKEGKSIALPPAAQGFCQARLFLVEIEAPSQSRRIQGAVLLPEVADYPDDKIEVVAPMRLKEELHLRDGDLIHLEFVS